MAVEHETRSADEQRRLAALARYAVLDTPPEAAFDRITELAARLFGIPVAITGFIDETRHWFKAKVGTELTENPRDQAFCQHTIQQCEVLVVPDTAQDERFRNLPLVQAGLVRFYAGAPLLSHDGQAIGTLCLLDASPRAALEGELEQLADLAALLVDELELRRVTREAVAAQQALAASETRLLQHNSLLRATLDATADGILSVDLKGCVTGYNAQYLKLWQVPEPIVSSGDDGRLLAHARTLLSEPDWFDARMAAIGRDPGRVTHDLLELKDGRVIERNSLPQCQGEAVVGRVWSFRDVTLQQRSREHLEQANAALDARVAARTKQLAAANKKLQKLNGQLLRGAFHDALTGLPNRALLQDRLGQALERHRRQPEQTFAVLHLDFDRFKLVNDGLGYSVGDTVLKRLANRLGTCLRPVDTLARLGADEFVLLLEQISGLADAEAVAERVAAALVPPLWVEDRQVHLTASIGIVLAHSAYLDPAELLRDADIAVACAKTSGKARYEVFTTDLRRLVEGRLGLETDFRQALERGEFEVHYQPIVALESGGTVGFEALVRWQHPQHGLVAPAEFIPIAEETGLIAELDRFVLREACKQVNTWRAQLQRPLSLNVNVSGQQLARGDLPGGVAEILQRTGFPAGDLRLELTESVLMRNTEDVCRQLGAIRALGVKLHIDDFGTGYSSLAYLQRFPVDAIKIDRSFVQRLLLAPEGQELVRSMLDMAASLHLKVVAEGIEAEAQRLALAHLGCCYGQGYLFSKPLPSASVAGFLTQPQVA